MIERIRADVERFVAIPSVVADPARADDLRLSAECVAEAFRDAGVPSTVEDAGGGPAVVGHRQGPPSAPTVLLYAHHDVQPVGEGWTCAPFALTERDGRWFGRGTADDKGGIAVHLAALRELGPDLPVSVAVLVEGEEEVGSPTLDALLSANADRVRADVAVAPDAVNAGPLAPTLTVSLRGLLTLLVTVRTAEHAVHSGIHGGAVPDALGALVRVLDSLVDTDGTPAVAGLAPGTDHGTTGPSETDLRAALLPGTRLTGRGSIAARTCDGPAITVTGIDAPPAAGAANVLVPCARASVSVRLAPEQEPADAMAALTAHLRAHVPWGAEITVETVARGKGWRAAPSRAADLAEGALTAAFGSATTRVGVGGGIPFVAALTSAFPTTDVLVTAVQDPATRAHSADESVDPRALVAAARAEVDLLRRLGRAST